MCEWLKFLKLGSNYAYVAHTTQVNKHKPKNIHAIPHIYQAVQHTCHTISHLDLILMNKFFFSSYSLQRVAKGLKNIVKKFSFKILRIDQGDRKGKLTWLFGRVAKNYALVQIIMDCTFSKPFWTYCS